MGCGSSKQNGIIEVTQNEWNRLESANASLKNDLNVSSAKSKHLEGRLKHIDILLTSFLEHDGVKSSTSSEAKLDAVFEAYAGLDRRYKDLKKNKRLIEENFKKQVDISKELDQQIHFMERQSQDQMRNMRERFREDLEKKDQEVRGLETKSRKDLDRKEREIRELEKRLIVGGDYSQPKPDTDLKQHFSSLQAKVRSFAESSVPMDEAGQQEFVYDLECKIQQPIDISHLKYFSEAALWAVLIEKVFSTPFKVFGTHGDGLFHSWLNFFADGQVDQRSAMAWPPPNSYSERWRSLTAGNLAATVQVQVAGNSAKEIRLSYRSNRDDIVNTLQKLYHHRSTADTGEILESITDTACHIAMTWSAERYRIQPAIPPRGTPVSWEDVDKRRIEIRNPGETVECTVGMVISPGLEKAGVGDGNAMSFDGPLRTLIPPHIYTFS